MLFYVTLTSLASSRKFVCKWHYELQGALSAVTLMEPARGVQVIIMY